MATKKLNIPPHIAVKALEIIRSFSKDLVQENSFSKNLTLMSEMAKEVVGADRASIWVIDLYSNNYITKLSDSTDEFLSIPQNTGIVGKSVQEKRPIIVNNPYETEFFNQKTDKDLGFVTKCVLSYPVFSSSGELIAVFQLVNKQDPNDLQEFLNRDLMLIDIVASLWSKILVGETYQKTIAYNDDEQKRAFKKQKTAIENDFLTSTNVKVMSFLKAADVLTGDMYSCLKTKDDGALIFVVDAMGHGIMPAITSYAFVSRVKTYLYKCDNLEALSFYLLDDFKNILSDYEALSCFFAWIDKDFTRLDYFGGGFYPPILHDNNKTKELKPNNLPFMSYTTKVKIASIKLENFSHLILYTDGLVEDNPVLNKKDIKNLGDEAYFEATINALQEKKQKDDTTIIVFKKL